MSNMVGQMNGVNYHTQYQVISLLLITFSSLSFTSINSTVMLSALVLPPSQCRDNQINKIRKVERWIGDYS